MMGMSRRRIRLRLMRIPFLVIAVQLARCTPESVQEFSAPMQALRPDQGVDNVDLGSGPGPACQRGPYPPWLDTLLAVLGANNVPQNPNYFLLRLLKFEGGSTAHPQTEARDRGNS